MQQPMQQILDAILRVIPLPEVVARPSTPPAAIAAATPTAATPTATDISDYAPWSPPTH